VAGPLNRLVSVIIPTYRDWDRLALCVEALSKQSYPAELFEVIIVNNDPEDLMPKDFVLHKNFQVLVEGKAGSYAARNAAIKIAKGEILAFTDSDCIPFTTWIENAVKFLVTTSYQRVAGNIELFYLDPNNRTDVENYEMVFAFKQKEVAENKNSSVTGNMITWKSVIDTVGLFNDTLFSGGDHEWALRAHLKGFKIGFGGDVSIFHPARSSIKQLIKKTKRISGGSALLTKKSLVQIFIKYLKTFKPPLYCIDDIKRHGNSLSLLEKTKVFFLKYYIIHITALEEVLIAFGKSSNRE